MEAARNSVKKFEKVDETSERVSDKVTRVTGKEVCILFVVQASL